MDANLAQNAVIDRALQELRRGFSICVEHGERRVTIAAAEAVTPSMYKQFQAQPGAALVLSEMRAAWLKSKFSGAIQMQLSEAPFSELQTAISDASWSLPTHHTAVQDVSELHALCEMAELIPAFLRVDGSPFSSAITLTLKKGDLDAYNRHLADAMEIVAESPLALLQAPEARCIAFRAPSVTKEHYAIIVGDPDRSKPVPVRVHSSSFINDVLMSLKADCRAELDYALSEMHRMGGGILVYLVQEGRGIGLTNVLRAYQLQSENGLDTVDANRALGFADDQRQFGVAAAILKKLGVTSIALFANNPRKARDLEQFGLNVAEILPIPTEITEWNKAYLEAKAIRLNHAIK